jgi:hypothetical protein
MPDRAALQLDPTLGTLLDRPGYHRDFEERYAGLGTGTSWKFERRQHFAEPGDPSWQALQQGRWTEALQLLEAEREELEQEVREDTAQGHRFHRVRVVEEPLVPYMQWELHALRIQAEVGNPIRVVPGEAVHHMEDPAPLPEVVVLGGQTLYQVCYTEADVPDGGIRFTEPGLVTRWERFIAELYEKGEDILAYAERALNHLPPPRPDAR